jgi:hypothetical protein
MLNTLTQSAGESIQMFHLIAGPAHYFVNVCEPRGTPLPGARQRACRMPPALLHQGSARGANLMFEQESGRKRDSNVKFKSFTRPHKLLVVLVIQTFAVVGAVRGCNCLNRITRTSPEE